MNTYEYRHASTVRKNAILPGDVHPALRSTSNSIARNALDAGLPAPVFPVATPKNDSAVLPVGSEFFINQVWDAYRVSAGHRSQLTITEARERYPSSDPGGQNVNTGAVTSTVHVNTCVQVAVFPHPSVAV